MRSGPNSGWECLGQDHASWGVYRPAPFSFGLIGLWFFFRLKQVAWKAHSTHSNHKPTTLRPLRGGLGWSQMDSKQLLCYDQSPERSTTSLPSVKRSSFFKTFPASAFLTLLVVLPGL